MNREKSIPMIKTLDVLDVVQAVNIKGGLGKQDRDRDGVADDKD